MKQKITKWIGVPLASAAIGLLLMYIQIEVGFAGLPCRDGIMTGTKCSFIRVGSIVMAILDFPFTIAALAAAWFGKIFAVPPGPPFTALNTFGQWLLYIVFFGLWILIGLGVFHLYQKRKNSPK